MKSKYNTNTSENIYYKIKEILEHARSETYRAVNSVMVQAYWEIGRIIVEEEQKGSPRADYGRSLLSTISIRLTSDYGKGFDESSLRKMRLFYKSFPIRAALRHELNCILTSIILFQHSQLAFQRIMAQSNPQPYFLFCSINFI